jgi:hypothetical protein
MHRDFEISLVSQMYGHGPSDIWGQLLSMVRSSVLYGDHVTVMTPALLVAEGDCHAMEWDRTAILDLMAEKVYVNGYCGDAPVSQHPPQLAAWAARRYREGPLPADMLFEAELLRLLRADGSLQKLALDAQRFVAQFRIAEDAGLVTVKRVAMPSMFPERYDPEGEVNSAVEEELARDTFLAVDESVADRVGLRSSAKTRRRPIRFGAALLDHLPGLADADMTEVLELREEIAESLVGLRAAMVDLSSSLPSDLPDDAFRAEVAALYVSRVAPSVEMTRRDMANNGLYTVLVERALKGGRLGRLARWATACLGLSAVSNPSAAGAAVGAALLGLTESVDLIAGAAMDKSRTDTSVRRSPFYLFVVAETGSERRSPRQR